MSAPTQLVGAITRTSCWETSMWGPTPCWTVDPDISILETLSRIHLRIPPECPINIAFLAEGAFNKLYTIATSNGGDIESQLPYVFRVTLPVEPSYKTTSEVATLSYIREHTSVPVPRIIAHSPTADNELGFEWILMEKIPGVSLKTVWREMDMEAKERVTRVVAQFSKQLRDRCSFDVIGNLYFREALLDRTVRTIPMTDDKFVMGPIVTAFMFAGGRKLRLPRNLGPYSDDAEYTTALTDAEAEDMKFLQSPEARTYDDFDEDVANDTPEIEEALRELQGVLPTLFPSHSRTFALTHHDLSLSNTLVDPTTHKITGIVDWECTGARPRWEYRYPVFLEGREIEEKPEPPSGADPDQEEFMTERWEDWEKTILRRSWDEELGNMDHEDASADRVRLEWRRQLDWLEIFSVKVHNWVWDYKESLDTDSEDEESLDSDYEDERSGKGSQSAIQDKSDEDRELPPPEVSATGAMVG